MNFRFRLRPRPDLSLADVVNIRSAGGAVMRSAHAGNWSPANLNVAALGLPCVLTDLTLTGADTIYHPSGAIAGRRFYPGLSARRKSLVVTTPVRSTSLPAGLHKWFPPGKNLADAHVDALRKAIPPADVVMFSGYARRYLDLVTALLEISADTAPELWRRRYLPHLGVQDVQLGAPGESESNRARRLAAQPRSWRDVLRGGVFGITDRDRGWLLPKAVMCLIMAIADAHAHGAAEVYHLSGVRMMNYSPELASVLQRLYAAAAPRLALPEVLDFHLLPSANMTLGAPETERSALDRLVTAYLAAFGDWPAGGRRTSGGTPPDAIELGRARVAASWAAVACATPFFDVRDADYCSQYDVLMCDTTWYTHPWGIATPLGTVGRMVSMLAQLRRPRHSGVPRPDRPTDEGQ